MPDTEAKRLIYKDDNKEEFHVYTPQELECKSEVRRLRQKALGLYKLDLDLLERAETAAKNGNLVEANQWEVKARECEYRGLAVGEEAARKHLDLLEGIGQIEGWELSPEEEGQGDA
jgi:hypothetical protein